jgi:hypothetical protein
MTATQKMSVLARMRLSMNKEVAAMTPDEQKNAVETMTHINEARFNLLDKISKNSPSYGEEAPPLPVAAAAPPEAVTPAAPATRVEQTRAAEKLEVEAEDVAESDVEMDIDYDIDDDDDDDDDDDEEEDDDDDDGDASETSVPDDFTHYFEGIQCEWLSPDDYNAKYVQNATAETDTPDELQHVANAQHVHNARVRLLREFTTKYDPQNSNAFFKRLKKAKHCYRVAPLKMRFDDDPLDDVYVASNAESEAAAHAYFFLKNFRNIAHAHLQRYFDGAFKATHVVNYGLYLEKHGKCAANAFFFSKFASEGVLFFLYARYTQSADLLTQALGLS